MFPPVTGPSLLVSRRLRMCQRRAAGGEPDPVGLLPQSARTKSRSAACACHTMLESAIAATVARRLAWPARHASPKKSPAPRIATTASYPAQPLSAHEGQTQSNQGLMRRPPRPEAKRAGQEVLLVDRLQHHEIARCATLSSKVGTHSSNCTPFQPTFGIG